jgi:hypothetical protein
LRGDKRAVGEVEILGGDSDRAVGIDPLEGRRARCRTGHEIEAEVADEAMAELTDHEIVEVTAAVFGEIGGSWVR